MADWTGRPLRLRFAPDAMIRPHWQATLDFAARASLADLVDPTVRYKAALSGDLGRILPEDAAMLADYGLPKYGGYGLHPVFEPVSSMWCGERLFMIASYDPDVGDPGGPEHRFAVEPATGQVVKVSQIYGGYRIVVNDLLRHFVEINWRYHHMLPILYDMLYSGEPGNPFADFDEADAVTQQAWATVLSVDKSLDTDNFWWHAIWALQ